MKLTDNFYKSEFESKDGATMPKDVFDNVKKLAKSLQTIRDIVNEPIHINSGYRSPNHNKAIGGSPNSQHLLGKAADIWCENTTEEELKDIIQGLIDDRYISEGGLGIYDTFIHYDIRGIKARWDFRNK